MAFAKNIGPHLYGFAGNAFNRIAAAIDAGVDVLDAEAGAGRVSRGRLPRGTQGQWRNDSGETLRNGFVHL